MAKIFLSHASSDLSLTHEVYRWLVEGGHEVFQHQHPRDGIPIGEDWEQRLYERLRWADAVVCLITPAYLTSMWCTAEIGAARSRGIRLLPLCAGPRLIHPLLTLTQHTDLDPDDRATARATLLNELRRVDAEWTWPDDRSPFPGLSPFGTDRRRVFFGRAWETAQLAGLLRSPAEHAEGAALLVLGPSGCGKSSLVRAGLWPVMADEPGWWTLPPILPGADPLTALVRELATAARQAGLDWTVAHVRNQLDHGGGLTGVAEELLVAAPDVPRRHLLVVVDQFEELLTQAAPAQRARFVELLRPALTGPVHLVATLRPEFLDQLLLDPDMAGLPTHTYTLRPLGREALRAVIEQPAERAGIDLDDGLADRLVDDTDNGEALPLLAFTLAQLANGITRGGRLSATRYDQLGGVPGALTQQADAALTEAIAAGGRSQDEVINGLLRLITVDEQGRPTRWRVNRADLPHHVVTELNAFVTRRLLTTDTDNGTAVIGVTHEAFLSAWPPLAEAITRNVSALRARRAVEQAATEWHDTGRPPTRLWSGGQLAAAVTDTGARVRAPSAPSSHKPRRRMPRRYRALITDRVDLSPKARNFLHASIRRDRFRRRRAFTALSMLLVLALVAAIVAVFAQQRTQQALRTAVAGRLLVQADAVREADPLRALQLGLVANQVHSGADTRAGLISTLVRAPGIRLGGPLSGHTRPILSVAFSPVPHQHILASSGDDNRTILWDITDRLHPRQLGPALTGQRDGVKSVAFSSDGRLLATGAVDGTVLLWDVADPAHPQPLGSPLTGTVPVLSLAFSPAPDRRILASGLKNGTVLLWDLTDPTSPRPLGQALTGHDWEVNTVAFSRDGKVLAVGSTDHTVVLWDVTDPTRPGVLGQPIMARTGPVRSVAFSPDGRSLAIGTTTAAVTLWDVSDPAQPRQLGQPLVAHSDAVWSVAFSPNGRRLATASYDNTVMQWDVSNREYPRSLGQPLRGHTNAVDATAFSPDGHTLATGSYDGTIILWDVTDQNKPPPLGTPLTGHTKPVQAIAYSPHHPLLATASDDTTAILWDTATPVDPHQLGQPLREHELRAWSLAFSPDGRVLAVGRDEGTALWDVADPARPRQLNSIPAGEIYPVLAVAFSPTQPIVAVTSFWDVAFWDVSDFANPRQLSKIQAGIVGPVGTLAFSPDGSTIAVGTYVGPITWIDVGDGTHPQELAQPPSGHNQAVRSVAFNSSGTILASGSVDHTIMLWDSTHPAEPRRFGPELRAHTNEVTAVAFAPTEDVLVTGSLDNTVTFWYTADPNHPIYLGRQSTGRSNAVHSVAFSPDGRILAAGAQNGTTILWNLDPLLSLLHNVAHVACGLTRGIDQETWDSYASEIPYEDPCAGSRLAHS